MHEFVVYDEYLRLMSGYFQIISEKAQAQLDALIKQLQETSTNAIMEGHLADDFCAFTQRAEALQSMIAQYGAACSKLLDEFTEQIIEIDQVR